MEALPFRRIVEAIKLANKAIEFAVHIDVMLPHRASSHELYECERSYLSVAVPERLAV